MFGLFKNKITHKDVVNQHDNSALIKAFNQIKTLDPEYEEPNYPLAEKVFQDFNSFQLKLSKEQTGPHLLQNLVPMSLLPYPKKYIKVAYYLYIDLANQKAPDMVRNIQELGFFLFSSYPNYEKYIDRLETVQKVDESGLAIIQEKFEKLFGTKEISKEEYFAGAGSQECSDEKITHDFGFLPNIEEDFDVEDVLKEAKEKHAKQEDEEEYDIEKIDSADISVAYEFIDAGVDISDHLDKFTGEKSSKLALKIIEADSEFGIFNVTNNISHFTKLNQEVAKKLIENDEAYCVGENIDKFTDLNQKTAELLIENDESDVVLENIGKFSIIDESQLALKIISHNPALGAFDVAQAFDKFTDLNQEVAENLVENDESCAVLENFDKFFLTNESRLALKIISHDPDGIYLTVDNLDKFKNLSEKVVSEIIKDKSDIDELPTHFEELNSHLESFTKEAREFIKETYKRD